jgi:hypothetical protein
MVLEIFEVVWQDGSNGERRLDMTGIVGITRRIFISITLALAISACGQDDKKDGQIVSEELKNVIARDGYVAIVLTKEGGMAKIVNIEGKEIKPCGSVEGTKVTGDCHLRNIDVENIDDIQVFITKGSPLCTVINIHGYLYQVYTATGKWPCP